jgi:hypothetical protein
MPQVEPSMSDAQPDEKKHPTTGMIAATTATATSQPNGTVMNHKIKVLVPLVMLARREKATLSSTAANSFDP